MSIGNKESNSVEGVLTFLNERPVVIDCGSNRGDWADILLKRFGKECDIHLFEPNKIMLDYCRIKYDYNDNITYNELAAYKENTTLQFHYFENFNNELSSIYKGEDWDTMPLKQRYVKTVKIADYCSEKRINYIDYLKIDCEGSDVDVLIGCFSMLKEGSIGVVQIEYGGHYPRANHTFDEVLAMAEETGYNVYYWNRLNYIKVERSSFVEDFRAEDFFLTKFNIPDYSIGWNKEFKLNTAGMEFEFVLEIGAFEGLTTKYICEYLLKQGGRVICIDPLEEFYIKEDTEHIEMFKGQYQRFIRTTRGLPVELIRKESKVAIPELNAFRFDFIFIDGNHTFDSVYFDACCSFSVCKIDGFILFDDYDLWRQETKDGIDKFVAEFSGSFEVVEKSYQLLIKKKHNQYNSLTIDYYK